MRTHDRRWIEQAITLASAAVAIGLLTGCAEDPRGLVEAMGRAYREAHAYSDDARMRIEHTRAEGTTEQTFPFRVAFVRPDKLRVEAYDARIVADGTRLRAAVGGVPGQVLSEEVTSPLALDQLFADGEVRATLAEGEAGCPVQLPLLLADDTVALILADALAAPESKGTETVDGHPCSRVVIRKPDGLLELWIDRTTKILRRMKVPTDAYAEMLSNESGAAAGVAVVVEFTDASFAASVPEEAFAFEVPAGAGEVSRLEPLRAPRAVSPLVGKRAEHFVLTTLEGRGISRDGVAGTPVVLEFFFVGCEPCNRTMPQVAQGIADSVALRRSTGQASPETAHFAVSVDEDDVAAADLRKKVAEFGGVGTIVRDPRGTAAVALGVDAFPTTVILGPDGTVADVLVGEHSRIAADVAASLAAVAAGQDVKHLVRSRYETRLRDYRDQLAQAAGNEPQRAERLPEQVIAPKRQPVRFKLVRAWRAEGVALPGNLFCLDSAHGGDEPPRIIGLDGWRTVVEIDADGREAARHELEIPEDAAVRFLRTAVDQGGRRWWLGGCRGGRHVFIFDQDWQLHATYPPPEGGVQGGISAAELFDLDADGTPEIVLGSSGKVGLQAASLAGQRLWENRSLGAVRDVAPADLRDGKRDVLCVTGEGHIVPVSPSGEADTRLPGCERPLRAVVTGPVAADGGWAAVGMASLERGRNAALGIGADGHTLWEMPLADGVHRQAAIEPIAWADLLGTPRRQWLVAAPDGSVAIAWADGRVVDRYQHGAALTGIGGYRRGNEGFIVLATRTGLEAYRLDDIALD